MSTTYPLGQNGSITLPDGLDTVHFHTIMPSIQHAPRGVGGSSGGSTDSFPVYVHGLPTTDYTAVGIVKVDGAGTYGLSQNSTLDLSTALDVQAQNWVLRRRWNLRDATGSGGTIRCYTYGVPHTMLNVAGIAESGYIADHAAQSISVSAVLSQVGTLAGTLKLANKVDQVSIHPGGHTVVRLGGMFSGATSFTSANGTQFDWLLADATLAPEEGTLTLDIGDATDLAPNVLVYDVTLAPNPRDGGEIAVVARMRVSAA